MRTTIRTISCIAFMLIMNANLSAHKYISKAAHAYFLSHTDAIDIDAHNYQSAIILDVTTQELVIIVPIKSFEFTLATAEKHFNETYMESDQFPKAKFKGKVMNMQAPNWSIEGSYPVNVRGELLIHGQSNSIDVPATITIQAKGISATCSFSVSINDYGISVPKGVKHRVAKNVDVKFDANLTLKE